jgi:starch synthase (maltosyl-transferring)
MPKVHARAESALETERPDLDRAVAAPRIVIKPRSPLVDQGRFAARAVTGQVVAIEADIFMDGHDRLAAAVIVRDALGGQRKLPLHALGNDLWHAEFRPLLVGRYTLTIEAWLDAWGTFRSSLEIKCRAKMPVGAEITTDVPEEVAAQIASDIADGRAKIDAAFQRASGRDRAALLALRSQIELSDPSTRVALLLHKTTSDLLARADPRNFLTRAEFALTLEVEREAAAYGAWYELFPRSQSADPARHATFDDVIGRLPAIRAMGFHVLYMPPIHPIGRRNRKGRNNSLTANPEDPGSPYAIGSVEGGHEAVHSALGGIAAFRRLHQAAKACGMEIALDFAVQCSPDHPWLTEHPEWFAWGADGQVRYAENPPKKYEDIVNPDFYAAEAIPGLWTSLRDIVLHWANEGIRIFRVDNPHTKPLPFWQWLIADVRAQYPDAIFLSEAFTRPAMMYRLAKIGFSQSYTYFTWRNTKSELTQYLTELTRGEPRQYFRPHFFVNTPDINPVFLQNSGRPGFLIRAALAATLSGLWGMYSGFELCESGALAGREEYLDSEKYQIKPRDWQAPGNIIPEITQLNRIRESNPALHTHLGLRFYNAFNDQVLYFGKATPDLTNFILVAVNLDPRAPQATLFEVPLWEFGLPDDASVRADDLLAGTSFTWQGKVQHWYFDPRMPFAIWRLHRPGH